MACGRSRRGLNANGRGHEGTHVTFPIGRPGDICIDRPGALDQIDPGAAVLFRAGWSILGKLPLFRERP
jgi:hypothetical protein